MAAKKRGRPKGSVNKKTVAKYNRLVKKHGKEAVDRAISNAEAGLKTRKGKRGRPRKVNHTADSVAGGSTRRKRGRPLGSKNKKSHKRGRPKGAKNKTMKHGKTVTITIHGK